MTLEVSPIDLFDIFSISTAFMLGLLFITSKSRNNRANVFLGLFLWSLSFEVLGSFLNGHQVIMPIVTSGLLTLFFLFLYIIKTLNYQVKLWYLLLVFPISTEIIGIFPVFITYVLSIFILVFILMVLKRHQQKLGDFYSETENKTLSWIKAIIYIYLFFYFFWIVEDIVGLKYEIATQYFSLTSTILTMVMIYWIGFKGFLQPEIFNLSILSAKSKIYDQDEMEENENPNNEIKSENCRSQYPDDTFHQLTYMVKSDKLYLQRDLTIRDLSRKLEINEKEFSKLINLHTQKNFYHYINQFRVEEFKRLIKTDKANHLSLLGLSEEAGFNSKSTFYSVFKTSEGITPKQYLDQVNRSE